MCGEVSDGCQLVK